MYIYEGAHKMIDEGERTMMSEGTSAQIGSKVYVHDI